MGAAVKGGTTPAVLSGGGGGGNGRGAAAAATIANDGTPGAATAAPRWPQSAAGVTSVSTSHQSSDMDDLLQSSDLALPAAGEPETEEYTSLSEQSDGEAASSRTSSRGGSSFHSYSSMQSGGQGVCEERSGGWGLGAGAPSYQGGVRGTATAAAAAAVAAVQGGYPNTGAAQNKGGPGGKPARGVAAACGAAGMRRVSNYSDVSFLSESDDDMRSSSARRQRGEGPVGLSRKGAQGGRNRQHLQKQQMGMKARLSQEDSNMSLELSDVGSSVLVLELGGYAPLAAAAAAGSGGGSGNCHTAAAASTAVSSQRVEMHAAAPARWSAGYENKQALKHERGAMGKGTGEEDEGAAMLIRAHRGRAANDGSGDLLAEISNLSSAAQSSRSSSGREEGGGSGLGGKSGYDQVLGLKTPGARKQDISLVGAAGTRGTGAPQPGKAVRGAGPAAPGAMQQKVGQGLPGGLNAADVFYGYRS